MVGIVPVVMLGLTYMMMTSFLARRMKALGLRAWIHAAGPYSRLITHNRHNYQTIHRFTHDRPFFQSQFLTVPLAIAGSG